MELASTLTPGPCSVYRQLQIGSEDSSFRNAIETISALEALRDALLYKSTTVATTTTTTTSTTTTTASSTVFPRTYRECALVRLTSAVRLSSLPTPLGHQCNLYSPHAGDAL